jgi:hypothetical protein
MIPESQLSKYLQENFEMFLPDDVRIGEASTENMVADFITYRQIIEGRTKSRGCSDEGSHVASLYSDQLSESDAMSNRYSTTESGETYELNHSHSWNNSSSVAGSAETGPSNRSRSIGEYDDDDDGNDDASIHCDINDDFSVLTGDTSMDYVVSSTAVHTPR